LDYWASCRCAIITSLPAALLIRLIASFAPTAKSKACQSKGSGFLDSYCSLRDLDISALRALVRQKRKKILTAEFAEADAEDAEKFKLKAQLFHQITVKIILLTDPRKE